MKYQGGKSKLAKHFAPIIESALMETDGFLYEPFTGGFNIVPSLQPGALRRSLNSDAHGGLITMYQHLQAGTWDPPETLTEEEYLVVKGERDWSKPITAFAAFGCSFRAFEFAGYGQHYATAAQTRKGLLRKLAFMGPVEFRWQDYEGGTLDCELEGRATIYTDPPYANTSRYLRGSAAFDYDRFYRWCGHMADAGHIVLMSEFTPPSGVEYKVVWEKQRSVRRDDPAKRLETEQLYLVKGTS